MTLPVKEVTGGLKKFGIIETENIEVENYESSLANGVASTNSKCMSFMIILILKVEAEAEVL